MWWAITPGRTSSACTSTSGRRPPWFTSRPALLTSFPLRRRKCIWLDRVPRRPGLVRPAYAQHRFAGRLAHRLVVILESLTQGVEGGKRGGAERPECLCRLATDIVVGVAQRLLQRGDGGLSRWPQVRQDADR